MTLTKAHIADSIYINCALSKTNSIQALETTLEIIKSTLEAGESVLITGFGKLVVKEKGKRRGRNPKTGDDMMLDARRVITFSCSGVLRDKLNEEL